MKTQADLTTKDYVYSVDVDEIHAWKIYDLKGRGWITILRDGRYTYQYEGTPESTRLSAYDSNCPCYIYTDFEVAQNAQLELRRTAVEKAKQEMLEAQEKYFRLVDKYKGTVCEKESTNNF
jgi:hypothetical protein